ncbi:MAG: hypothetical protein GFH27_549327n15 [Chloroflexi bacterium AL-W]|nr:hypothetical protein [Chloroflexi bacterium AL-N1]NOK69627.1 hypothetical protein [Chloroflexi bacterium AL-N10]NOK72174.1 hypothetical protein [Chloroflexi bacterium AL-N5]NOK85003.1 hypothetical protein [Chloroflexi bacterium AL-W]NOK91756.1 hypothetical protein [Chloroflexi bacterium AL-N15]
MPKGLITKIIWGFLAALLCLVLVGELLLSAFN